MKELIQIKISRERKEELKELAKAQGITLNAFMCIIINDYLKKNTNE